MHQLTTFKLVTLFTLLLLGLCTLSPASPVPDQNASQDFNYPALVYDELLLESGQVENVVRVNLPAQEPNEVVSMSVCISNSNDPNMCTVGYVTGKNWGSVCIFFLFFTLIPPKPCHQTNIMSKSQCSGSTTITAS
jgi:hypothetical protein